MDSDMKLWLPALHASSFTVMNTAQMIVISISQNCNVTYFRRKHSSVTKPLRNAVQYILH